MPIKILYLQDTMPPISTLGLTDAELQKLRGYQGYWYLVRKHRFIQIFLDPGTVAELKAQRKKFVKAIVKEKSLDLEGKKLGQLSFSWFENILFVRLI